MTPDLVLEPVLRGLSIGALYAVVAMGLSLIFGIMRVINVAHGEFVMLGGYGVYFMWTVLKLDPLVGLFLLFPTAMLFGILIERTLVEHVVGKPEISSLMLTFGLSVVIWGLVQILFGADFRSIQYLSAAVSILGVHLAANSIVIFVVSLAVAGGVFAFLRLTNLGQAIRATSQNAALAQACGINSRMMRSLGFGLGTALAATGGGMVAFSFVLYPQVGLTYIGKSFAVAVLGGMGSVPGAIVGGFVLGLAESFAAQHLTSQAAQLISYALIFFVIMVRPAGLFGRPE
jgi:branched-chain amino acid transport system permease protein